MVWESKINYGARVRSRIKRQPVAYKGMGGQVSSFLPLTFISVIISVTHRSSHHELKPTLPINLEAFMMYLQLPLWLLLVQEENRGSSIDTFFSLVFPRHLAVDKDFTSSLIAKNRMCSVWCNEGMFCWG